MQIKIFRDMTPDGIENKVNSWIEETWPISYGENDIEDIRLIETENYFTAMVIYSRNN